MKYPINIKKIRIQGKKPAMIFTFFCFTIRYADIGNNITAEKVINAKDELHRKAEKNAIPIIEIVWLN
jgi:hypothetical protein